jgi:hypothetical protein
MSRFFYLTIQLSNCTYNGSTFLTDESLFALESSIRNGFAEISNLDFRGVGANVVKGSTNSLTLGIAAGYFGSQQDLTNLEVENLRINVRSAMVTISGLTFSEIRIEVVLLEKTYV